MSATAEHLLRRGVGAGYRRANEPTAALLVADLLSLSS